MNPPPGRLLPHEWVFGGHLLLTWLLLLPAEGFAGPDTLVYTGLLLANVAVLAWATRGDSKVRWRVRLLFYPLAMNVGFAALGTAVPAIRSWTADSLLRSVDAAVLGETPSRLLEPLVNRPLTEALSFCYLLFFPNMTFGLLYYVAGDLGPARRFYAGLFTLYGIGFLGYTLMPAGGPCKSMAGEFTVPLEGWWFTGWNAALVKYGSNGVDVFPSLHCAISTYILLFDRRHRPWRYRLYLVPCVGLWISTVYLRYHYLVDCASGFALAAFCLRVAGREEETD